MSNILFPLTFSVLVLTAVSSGLLTTFQYWVLAQSATPKSTAWEDALAMRPPANEVRHFVSTRSAAASRVGAEAADEVTTATDPTVPAAASSSPPLANAARVSPQDVSAISSPNSAPISAQASAPANVSSKTPPIEASQRAYPPTGTASRSEPTAKTVSRPVNAPKFKPPSEAASSLLNKAVVAADPVTTSTATSTATSANASPVMVVYEDELVIEFPKAIASTRNIKNAVSRALLMDRPMAGPELMARDKLDLTKRPYFYRKVLDQHQQPIRYPKQAFDYADYLMQHHQQTLKDEEGEFVALHIPLHEFGLSGPAKSYQAWVKSYADQFQVPESLVYAVMETESAFNPKAVSRSNAIGLMQVKAEAAGKDVYQYIDAKPGQPSLEELFDSEKNIRMGTAYLGLLKHDYLAGIVDDKIKQMVTISSYNGGMKTVLRLFGQTPEAAIERLNRLSQNQVYRTLRYEHHSDETRRYLDKVMQAETKYRELLQET
ncbi:MAG: murein transglycosylase domain-containing protein [Hydrogenovibrio sp.]